MVNFSEDCHFKNLHNVLENKDNNSNQRKALKLIIWKFCIYQNPFARLEIFSLPAKQKGYQIVIQSSQYRLTKLYQRKMKTN